MERKMTRINLIPPEFLTSKHLVAEYRELPRLAKFAASKPAGYIPPESYRLGTGHMNFFVDKGKWLANRHKELVTEMKNRGYTVNFPDYPDVHPKSLMNDWKPNAYEIAINLSRLEERK